MNQCNDESWFYFKYHLWHIVFLQTVSSPGTLCKGWYSRETYFCCKATVHVYMRWFIQHQQTTIIILRALLRAQQQRTDSSHICFRLYFYTGRGIKASLKHNPLPCFARETLITTCSNFYVHSVSSVILLCSTEFSGFIFRKFSNFYYYKFFVLIFLVLVFFGFAL